MKAFLMHIFVPHHSNNHRAKLLHHSSIFFLTLFFFVAQFFITSIKQTYPAVLGTAVDMSTQKLLDLTNKDRKDAGLDALTLNATLSQAAALKADYMFEKNFWAHNGPDGTTPWVFFKKVGYTYIYAGENLARGFTDSGEVNDAWMNSPSHRENILSPNYKEIGFAIKQGRLLGEDTTLVVELFGSKEAMPVTDIPETTQQVVKNTNILPAATAPQNVLYTIKTSALLGSRGLTQNIGFFVLFVFIVVLAIDIIIVQRKKIVRFVGHNSDHIFFLTAVFIIMMITLKGLVV